MCFILPKNIFVIFIFKKRETGEHHFLLNVNKKTFRLENVILLITISHCKIQTIKNFLKAS